MSIIFKLYPASTNQIPDVDPDTVNNNFATSVMDMAVSHTTDATTGNTTDANSTTATVSNELRIDNLIISSSSGNFSQDIKTFLSKPRILNPGILQTTDIVSTFPSFVIPQAVLSAGLIQDKIRGFLGFRGTSVFRLQVNANPFQQGRYMLAFVHSGGSAPSTPAGVAWYNMHMSNLTQRTQLPRVEIDISCDTEAILRIPYNSCLNFTPLGSLTSGDQFGAIGTVQLFPYVALATGTGSANCAYTLWHHFEDVELIGPSAPQSGRIYGSTRGRKSITEKEADSVGMGPVQSTLIKVSNASSLFKSIPLLSAYASSVSWMSDIAASAAGVFGFSRPVNLEHAKRMTREVMPYFCNVDAPDQSMPLSLAAKNSVVITPGFSGTDTDEMDFGFIATVPAWLFTNVWTTSITSGSTLFTLPISPNNNALTRTVTGGLIATAYVPVAFVSTYFNYWRGSLIFNFKVVKTEYHSGRIMIAFFPGEPNETNPVSFANSDYCHREIIDIRECNTFVIKIPFISSSPYKPLVGVDSIIGTLGCYVVDALVAPSTCSSNVQIICEKSGGPDIEFSIPTNVINTPFANVTPEAGKVFEESKPQPNNCSELSTDIGSSSVTGDSNMNAAVCIGESISSFRTLLKQTNLIPYTATLSTPAVKFTYVNPYAWTIMYNSLTNPIPTTQADLYGTLCSLYAYSRGGVRIKFTDNVTVGTASTLPVQTYMGTQNQASPSVTFFANTSAVGTDALGLTTVTGRIGVPTVFTNINANECTEIQVPQYHRYHSRSNQDQMASANTPYVYAHPSLSNRMVISRYYPNPTPAVLAGSNSIYRAGSDDVNFGLFISIPFMGSANTIPNQ